MWQSVECGRSPICLVGVATLWAAVFLGHVPRCWSMQDEFIDGAEAVRFLNSQPGQNVLVVLEDMAGEEIVMHAQVASRSAKIYDVVLEPMYKHRPGSDKLLIVEYYEKKLGRPLTDSPEDRALIKTRPRVVGAFSVDGVMVRDYKHRYKVKRVERLDMSGPKFPVAMTVKAIKLPDNDPWIGTRDGDPSNWVIEYTIKGEPKPFRYRIPFRDDPKRSPITTVDVREPGWRYQDGRFLRVIRFEVRQGPYTPFGGGFELDEWGYPIDSWFTNVSPIFDKDLASRLTPWHRWALRLKNHEFESYAEAQQAQPSTLGRYDEIVPILKDVLASTEDAHVQYLTLCTLERISTRPADVIPLLKQCLEAESDEVVEKAQQVLDAYEKYQREQSERRRY